MTSTKLNQWTGLLRWSLQYQDGTSETSKASPMDPERRAWLQQALEAHMVDPMDELKALIAVLQTPRAEPDAESGDDDEFTQRKIEALFNCMGFVEQIDWARDFNKLGGLETVVRMTEDKNEDIRCAALEVAGAVVQNNPPCQEAAMALGLLPVLLRALRRPHEELSHTERAKTLMATSSLVRSCTPATVQFIREQGVALLLSMARAAESAVGIRAQRKALFMLRYILSEVPAVRVGGADALAAALNDSILAQDVDLRENSLQLLISIYRDAHAARRVEDATRQETAQRLLKFEEDGGHFKEAPDEQSRALAAELRAAVAVGAEVTPEAAAAEAVESLKLEDSKV